MRKLLLLSLMLPLLINAQPIISLDSCLAKTDRNHPLKKNKKIQEDILSQKLTNIQTSYYPQFSINGQATYQSDVTKIDFSIPNLPIKIDEPDKDQYKINVELSQLIYDGGMNKSRKNLEKSVYESEILSTESELYKIKENVIKIYFNILVLKKTIESHKKFEEDITLRIKRLEATENAGSALKMNIDILKVEWLKIQQLITEVENSLLSNIDMLTEWTGEVVNEKSTFLLPEVNGEINYLNNRLELKMLDNQKNQLNEIGSVSKSKSNPRVYAFGQAGYGKPGLNMLTSEFEPFWLIGAKLSWSLWDWNVIKREKEIISLQTSTIDIQKEIFDKTIRLASGKYKNEIEKMDEIIERDQEIFELRQRILKVAEVQHENGIITTSELLIEANSLQQAMLNLEIHKLQKIRNIIEYQFITGNL